MRYTYDYLRAEFNDDCDWSLLGGSSYFFNERSTTVHNPQTIAPPLRSVSGFLLGSDYCVNIKELETRAIFLYVQSLFFVSPPNRQKRRRETCQQRRLTASRLPASNPPRSERPKMREEIIAESTTSKRGVFIPGLCK